MHTTLDALIEALQAQKNAGLPGDTPVGIYDNGSANLAIEPRQASVAKAEHQKGWTRCKVVSRGGVPVILIG